MPVKPVKQRRGDYVSTSRSTAAGRRRASANLHGSSKDLELPPAGGERRNLVNALAKGLRVLEVFTGNKPEMTLSEVAAAAELDPGTTFRMLNTLVALGYVARIPDTRRFRLSLRVVDLGLNAIARTDVRDIARPILRSLVNEVNEAASLGVLDGADILYIERVRAGVARIGVDIRIGTTIPAVLSAIGQSVLAFLPDAELARVLALPPRRDGLPIIAISDEEVGQALSQVRSDGYALHDSYFGSGLRVLAVPVFDSNSYPMAGLSVAAPLIQTSRENFCSSTLRPLKAAAAEIGRALEASGSIASGSWSSRK